MRSCKTPSASRATRKKGPAVVKAAKEFIRHQMAREFGRKLMEGDFGDYPLTNEEIEDFDR